MEDDKNKTLVDKIEKLIEAGQKKVLERLDGLEAGQKKLEVGQTRLEAGVSKLEAGVSKLESGQANLQSGLKNLEVRQSRLEDGQKVIVETIKTVHASLKNEIMVTGTAVKETIRDELKIVKNDFDARITKLEAVSR